MKCVFVVFVDKIEAVLHRRNNVVASYGQDTYTHLLFDTWTQFKTGVLNLAADRQLFMNENFSNEGTIHTLLLLIEFNNVYDVLLLKMFQMLQQCMPFLCSLDQQH